MQLRRLVPLAVLPLSLGLLSSCAAFSDTPGASDGGTPEVVAAFYPLEYVAQRVAGDDVEVTDLTTPGQEPHDLELSVAANAAVATADLVVFEGGLQAAVDDAVEQSATGTTLDVTDVVTLEPFGGHEGEHQDHEDGDEHADEHADEHGDEHGHEEGDGHDHGDLGDLDPHFWQDPLLMADLGDAVADSLGEIDPDQASSYAARADELRDDLEALDDDYTRGLADCERQTVVVSHDAFGYLDRYGLEFEPVAGLSPEAEPSPADLARLQDLIRTDGITTVFSERLVSPRLTSSLAADAGVTTAVLDPVEGLTDETASEDYLSLMRENLAALEQANGCR